MPRRDFYKLAARVLLAWSILSVAGMLWGRYVIELLIPFLVLVTDAISPSYTSFVDYLHRPDGDQVFLTAFVTRPMYVDHALTLNPGATLTVGIDAGHVLVPLVILFTVLLAWPVARWRDRARLLALGVLTSFIVLGLTAPFLLAGKIETMLIGYAAQAGETRSSLLVDWMIFGESGGLWLMPLVAAAICGFRVSPTFGKQNGARELSTDPAAVQPGMAPVINNSSN